MDISGNENIKVLQSEDNQIKMKLASGSYSFKIK